MSYDSEREIGWNFDIEAQKALPIITDLAVLEFMDDLGNELVESLGEQPFDYRFRVIVNPELNAFAVPGGYIYFHSGTLLTAGDVEELAGVMAHELAHVKGRHQARLAQDIAIPSILASLAGLAAGAAAGSAGPLVAAQGANVALQLQYTRQYEDEADRVGAVFLTRAGWHPSGMVRFFERIVLEEEQAPEGFIPPYLYSHPAIDERIEVVRDARRETQADEVAAAPRRSLPGDAGAPRLPDRAQARRDGRHGALRPRSHRPAARRGERARRAPATPKRRSRRSTPRSGSNRTIRACRCERGEILMAAGRPADAVVAYRRAVYLDPNPPSRAARARRAPIATPATAARRCSSPSRRSGAPDRRARCASRRSASSSG